MVFNVQIDSVFDEEKEKDKAFSDILLEDNKILKWDNVKGELLLESSFIEVESFESKVKASLFDSFDAEFATFIIEIENENQHKFTISHVELENLMNESDLTFIGALNQLVINYLKTK